MKNIKDILLENCIAVYLLADPTLSGSERAQAVVTTALVDSWDRLDGRQQRAIVDALEQSTRETEDAEAWIRGRIAEADTHD